MSKTNDIWADAMDALVPYYFADGKFVEKLEGKVYPVVQKEHNVYNEYHWVQVIDGCIARAFTREEVVWR